MLDGIYAKICEAWEEDGHASGTPVRGFVNSVHSTRELWTLFTAEWWQARLS